MLFSASEKSSNIMKEDVWLVDSGCTNHMTKEAKYFTRLDRSINVPIKVGNGEVVMTAGKGDIVVMTDRGEKTIKDVFLVPGLEKNLFSVPQIISRGYRVLFENKRCIISDSHGNKVIEIEMIQKGFPIKWNSTSEKTMDNEEPQVETNQIISSSGHSQFGEYDENEEEGEGEGDISIPPRKYKYMSEILQTAPRVENEDFAQMHEACFLMSNKPQSYDGTSRFEELRRKLGARQKLN